MLSLNLIKKVDEYVFICCLLIFKEHESGLTQFYIKKNTDLEELMKIHSFFFLWIRIAIWTNFF